MAERFARTELLLGSDAIAALGRARIAVFGLGGVGGAAAEALARSGIGALDLVDPDSVNETNVNRQLVATCETVGRPKVEVMAERVRAINPNCRTTAHECFFLPETAERFDFSEYDYVVDAIDTVTGKLLIAQTAQDAGTPLISSMGTANKLDPTALEVALLSQTSICPLAKIIRKECRKRGIGDFKVVYSREPARRPYADDERAREMIEAERARTGRRDTPGSVAFVPPVAGLICAAEVVRDLTGPAS